MSSKIKNGNDTLKIFLAIMSGRNISVTDPFFAPCFSASVVNGHMPLFRRSMTPFTAMEQTAIRRNILKVLVMPA